MSQIYKTQADQKNWPALGQNSRIPRLFKNEYQELTLRIVLLVWVEFCGTVSKCNTAELD